MEIGAKVILYGRKLGIITFYHQIFFIAFRYHSYFQKLGCSCTFLNYQILSPFSPPPLLPMFAMNNK